MKKYYGYFIYDDKEYVIRFKIKGSLCYSSKEKCFVDKDWYVRSIGDVICYAALENHPINVKKFGFSMLITHAVFKDMRANGVTKWVPKVEIIDWD